MADILLAIERLPPVEALKSSFVAYPLVNALHILAIGILLTSVIVMDLAVLGAIRSLPTSSLVRLMRRFAIAAFVVALASGLMLFSVRASEYAGNSAFLIKLCLIIAAGVNLAAFAAVAGWNHETNFSPGARLMAALSIALWLSVLVAGRFIGFL